MIALVLAAVAALADGTSFDNAKCRDFLVGAWDTEGEQPIDGHIAHIHSHAVYGADGTFGWVITITEPGLPPQKVNRRGTWDAGPGPKPDTCRVITYLEGEPDAPNVLTVVDADTVAGQAGTVSIRVAP